ncbi:MAG: CooT family nickel-binding protein [Oscillospiraceae bacterium]|nr:CooT family nickel-binding protein [Oscillospiraceae bacterium]
MCLSTVYKNKKEESAIVMRNVMRLECKDGCVILTDLMDRTVEIPGQLVEANLVDGFVIVEEAV